MKKFLAIIPLAMLISALYLVPAYAMTLNDMINNPGYSTIVVGYLVAEQENRYEILGFWGHENDYMAITEDHYIYPDFPSSSPFETHQVNFDPIKNPDGEIGSGWQSGGTKGQYVWIVKIRGNVIDTFDIAMTVDEYLNPEPPPEPDEGLPGFLHDMWEAIFELFGWNDDYTDDISDIVQSPSEAHHGFEYITPSPAPTPTPYSLSVEDQNGNTVYNITGIPSGDNTTNNYYGDDFDIFEVDVKLLPSGGVSNPKEGLNSVMYSNDDVLNDINIEPVGYSVSVIPSDWYIMLGVFISMPFIAGFISKLLK